MRIPFPPLLLFSSILMLFTSGCISSPMRQDARIMEANIRAVTRAQDTASDSVVFFQVENPNPRQNQPRIVNFSGIVLTPEGHLLAPFTIRKDSNTRMEAWVGQRRYLTRPLLHDEGLGMTILKIEPEEPLVPLDMSLATTLPIGAHAFCVIQTDDDREFEPFIFQGVCQGIVQGRYRQYSLSFIPDLAKGAPLFDRMGRWVGIASQNNGWMAEDLIADLDDLLHRATNGRSDKSPDESEDAWFGAILSPINSDFARAMDLPRSGLWLSHVFPEGSAAKAGLQTGDLLVAINGSDMRLSGSRAYRFYLQTLRPRENQPFTATVIRDGKKVNVKGKLLERPDPDTLRAEDLGFTVTELHDSMTIRYNLFESQGVMVVNIKSGSPAATGRTFGEPLLRNRDVITALGGKPTPDIETFGKVLEEIRLEKPDALLVEFQRGAFTGIEALNLKIGEENNGETP